MVTGKLITQFACILSLTLQLHLRETYFMWIRAQTYLCMAKHSVKIIVLQLALKEYPLPSRVIFPTKVCYNRIDYKRAG